MVFPDNTEAEEYVYMRKKKHGAKSVAQRYVMVKVTGVTTNVRDIGIETVCTCEC